MDASARSMAPGALTQFVLKIHSRCDLACDHCYVYEHLDQSWRRRPLAMPASTVRKAAERIAEHAVAHGLSRVRVVLHGGEPLLVGPNGLRAIAAQLRNVIGPVTELDLLMQSNGVLLGRQVLQVLLDHDIRVGISLDGDRAANDRHRRYANGQSSHDAVLRSLALLREPEHRRLYAGILCTIDVRNDPITVYEALLGQEPPRIDFLLPHATWDTPPLRPGATPTPYADWLLRIFRRWSTDGRPVPIRTFDSVRATARGGRSGTEALGLDEVDLTVIEADGSFEQVDSLKVTRDGGSATGLNVFTHTVDEVAAHPAIARRRTGLADLSATCRACNVLRQCGGGLFTHRYRTENGFANPSVYCADLKELIMGINEREPAPARRTLPVEEIADLGLAVFDAIGAGYGDRSDIGRLADLQLSVTRTLVAGVAAQSAVAGWQLLLDVDKAAPWAVQAVLRHPYVRQWAVTCLGSAGAHAEVLNWIAAAAAIRAGLGAELAVPVVEGAVYLPTLGVADLSGADSAVLRTAPGSVRLVHDDRVLTIDLSGSAPATAWVPSAHAELDGHSVVIEDSDPYRSCHQWPTSGRLNREARVTWQHSLAGAWRVVRSDAPRHAPGLVAGLHVVTPLAAAPDGTHRASSTRHAFGAVAAAQASHEALAVMLVHEFQHAKLAALLDVVDLVDRDYRGRLQVGWRPDPRPPEAALHGIYAHSAVAEMWLARSERDGADRAEAAANFRQYRDWTAAAIDALRTTGALTPAGDRILDLVGATVDTLR